MPEPRSVLRELVEAIAAEDGALWVLLQQQLHQDSRVTSATGRSLDDLGDLALEPVDYVSGSRSPSAVATATPDSGQAPLEVTFDSSDSSDPENEELTFAWDFDGDGETDSTEAGPTHTYTENGVYNARLVERVVDRMAFQAGQQGYAFLEVRPRIEKNEAARTVDIVFELVEGERVRSWFVDGVVKEHRTIATYVNGLIHAGLVIDRMEEWGPSAEAVAARPELADDRHRPWFLLLRATRPSEPGSGLGEGLGEAG